MENKWTRIKVNGKKKDLDTICAVLSMIDEGLLIDDVSDLKVNEMYGDLIDENVLSADPDKIAVSVFISEDKPFTDCMSYIKDRFASLGVEVSIECEGVNAQDWAQSYKKYYHPVSIGKITIVPAWEEYKEKEGEVVVRMDPGMAFGTGTHETTRLAIRMLQKHTRKDARVLDIGTGSGILSICASKLGAQFCNAYDIDEDAVKVARENIEKNGVTNVTCEVSDLLSAVKKPEEKYHLVLANIVSDIILRLLPDLGEYMVSGGRAVLSGIIEPRRMEIYDCALKNGFAVIEEIRENDWVGIALWKK